MASGGVSATGVAAAAVRREEERRAAGFAGASGLPRGVVAVERRERPATSALPGLGDVRLAGTAEPDPEPSPVTLYRYVADHRVEAAALEGPTRGGGRRRPPRRADGVSPCDHEVVPARWRTLDQPGASTATEETAHGVDAPAGDVLAKRPDWQAWRWVREGSVPSDLWTAPPRAARR